MLQLVSYYFTGGTIFFAASAAADAATATDCDATYCKQHSLSVSTPARQRTEVCVCVFVCGISFWGLVVGNGFQYGMTFIFTRNRKLVLLSEVKLWVGVATNKR